MTENSSADATQSRQVGFVRYCLKAENRTCVLYESDFAGYLQFEF